MRRTLFVIALLTALVPMAGTTSSAQVNPLADFSGYSTGTAMHADALKSGTTLLEDTEVAFSGANVNSRGLGAALMNEMEQAYQTAAEAGDRAAGRGSGLEIGLATTVPNLTNANQINPGSTVSAFAPESTGLLTEEFIPVDVDPIVKATTLRGQAQAIYSDKVCVLGQPISSGLGYAANANLVNSGTPATSLLATNTVDNAVSQSKSFTYLIPNGDGTYGLVSETRQILAPVTLIPGVAGIGTLVVEFAGEWVLRSTATGKDGGAKVEYAPAGSPSPTVKVIVVKLAGVEIASLTTKQLLEEEGLVLPISVPGLVEGEIAIGEDPRAIGGNADSQPVMMANGTMAAAAVDVVRVNLSLGDALRVTDLRVGHMESRAMVPVGGIQCGIPVTKTGTPASVTVGQGQVITYTITVPSDVEAFKAIACDVVNLKVTDVTTAENGVKFEIVSASNDGKISGNTVTWDKLGTYKPGDPAIVLTIGLKVPVGSAAGKITDTATATGVLDNCKGNASANADSLSGLATMDSAALTGNAAFSGVATTVAGLAAVAPAAAAPAFGPTPRGGVATGAGGTDQSNPLLPVAAGLGFAALLGSTALLGFAGAQRRRIG